MQSLYLNSKVDISSHTNSMIYYYVNSLQDIASHNHVTIPCLPETSGSLQNSCTKISYSATFTFIPQEIFLSTPLDPVTMDIFYCY